LPMAMPAIAPVDRLDPPEWLASGVAVGATAVVVAEVGEYVAVRLVVYVAVCVCVDVVAKGSSSDGQSCPGKSMKDEFAAYSFCTSMDTLALGLMTPTIWKPMQEFGAPQ
jgi:hypothetical protein